MQDSADLRVVFVTAPTREVATKIARSLVAESLIACANLIPAVQSIYRWEGAVAEEEECLMILKTESARCAALEARVSALHPYEVPEFLVLPVAAASTLYAAWVRASVEEPS